MKKQILVVLVSALVTSFLLLGCGKMKLPTMPLEESKNIRANLESQHEMTLTTIADAKQRLKDFPTIPEDIDMSQFNSELLKVTLTECYNAPIEMVEEVKKEGEVAVDDAKKAKVKSVQKGSERAKQEIKDGIGNIKECAPNTLNTLTDYKKDLDDSYSTFINNKFTAINEFRVISKEILPRQIEDLTKMVATSKLKVEEYKKTSEANLKLAEKNPTMSSAKKTEYKNSYTETKKELDSIESILGNLENDAKAFPGEVRTMTESVATDINSLGSN